MNDQALDYRRLKKLLGPHYDLKLHQQADEQAPLVVSFIHDTDYICVLELDTYCCKLMVYKDGLTIHDEPLTRRVLTRLYLIHNEITPHCNACIDYAYRHEDAELVELIPHLCHTTLAHITDEQVHQHITATLAIAELFFARILTYFEIQSEETASSTVYEDLSEPFAHYDA